MFSTQHESVRPPQVRDLLQSASVLALAPGIPMPNHCRDIYDQGYFDACFDPWFRRMGQLLNGTCMKPPEPLVMGLERVKKCYAGHWFTFTDGVGALTDFTHKVVTHLMVDYLMEFAPNYPDQALFSTLEYGVDFQTTGLEPMLVLQAHSNSMLQVEEKIMCDLKRRTGMGWYAECSSVPLWPMRSSRIQARARPTDPDRPRQLVNASAPHIQPTQATCRLSGSPGRLS